ncbi:hypothetical protein D3C76_1115940 [compost metagenome]
MGERDEAGGLELVGGGVEFVEGGWRLVDASLLEDVGVDPQPVDAVDVHRHGDIVTVVLHGVRDLLVEQGVPLFVLGHILEHIGVEQAGGRPVLDVRALDLRDTRRVAGHGAALEHGHGGGTTTTGDGAVLPGEAIFFDLGLEHIDRRFFTTGGPPVHHLDTAFGIGSQGTQREQGGQ